MALSALLPSIDDDLPVPLDALLSVSLVLSSLLLVLGWRYTYGLDPADAKRSRNVEASWAAAAPAKEWSSDSVVSSGEGESAETCWARKDGVFKHCGLREDVFASELAPRYSLGNLELPLPAMTPSQLADVNELATRVKDLQAAGKRTDLATLWRYLSARKGNLPAAEAYFRKAMAYRDEINLDEMDSRWNLEAYERCFAPWWCRGGIVGHGLSGQVVGFERLGRGRFPELLANLPWDVFRRLDALFIVRSLAAFEEDALRRGVPVGNNTLILDLEGLSWNWCKPHIAKAYGKLVEMRDMLLPCTLGQILIIRAPQAFTTAWSLAQRFLDANTRSKVQIASGDADSLALLRRYVPDEVIPAYVGGQLRTHGDPECRLLLGSAARQPVPSEAYRRLLAMVAEDYRPSEAPDKQFAARIRDDASCMGPFACCLAGRH